MNRNDFPLLASRPDFVYLDSASTTHKPKSVIDAITGTYENHLSNPHRGLYDLSQDATDRFELARSKVASFINASYANEIVFTSGTTDGLNLIARAWAKQNLAAGDIIITSDMEHHSNFLPWQRLRDELGIKLHSLKLDEDYRLKYEPEHIDLSRVKLVALTHASNVLGTINPIKEIAEYYRSRCPEVVVLVDAAQSVGHMPLDVRELGVDFLAFSAHKMFGPSGVGVLYGKKELLEQMEPWKLGGQMINSVAFEHSEWAEPPHKFEAGSQNVEGVVGLGVAVDYLSEVGMDTIHSHGQKLTEYGLEKLTGVNMVGPSTANDRLPVFSFNIEGVHAHDAAEILNRRNIAVRAGHHCAQTLMNCLDINGTLRASLHFYNTTDDIDALVSGLEEVHEVLRV